MIDEKRLYRALGQNLRMLREEHTRGSKRMTQADLASAVGMERTSITNIEKGNQKVPLHVLYRMCEVLGADPAVALPPLDTVRTADVAASQEIEFAGTTQRVTPKVAQALTALLTDFDDQDSGRTYGNFAR